MHIQELERLGARDLSICGLRMWIHGRQFPDAADYWDGNWLRATAYCVYPHSTVRFLDQACIRVDELTSLLSGCEKMYATLSGKAALTYMEPNLSAQLDVSTNGHIRIKLSITPDYANETHEYEDEIDQSYLPAIISSCEVLVSKFPLREGE